MADGEITLKLDAETERRLRAVADARGRSVEDYLRELIVDDLTEDWAEDERIAGVADQSDAWRPAEVAVSYFRSALHERVKKTR